MGSQLLAAGLSDADYGGHPGCHEYLNRSRPDVVRQIHRNYFAAGAQIVETNSFGGAAHILAEHGLGERAYEINRAAAAIARQAADELTTDDMPRFVAGSIGPGSKLPSLGQITFDELVSSYTPQAQGLLEGGVDCFICETSQDLLQLKSAIVTIREISKDIPVIAQVTIDQTGRTLTGSDVSTMLAALEPMPVQAIGLNCGLGPGGMSEAIHYLAAHSTKPLSVMPNAGLPKLVDGAAVYQLKPKDFAGQMKRYCLHPGLNIVGGCCGTTPAHIAALAAAVRDLPARKPAQNCRAALSSLFQSQELAVAPKPLIIGERTNASGSRVFKSLLLEDDFDAMMSLALEQEREGAHLLDLSLAAAGRNERADMGRFAAALNQRLRIPVMIDSTDPEVIEDGLRRLAGRGAVNSASLERGEDKAKRIIGLCAQYGAAMVCLAIDEKGMAMTAERKVEVCSRLRELALRGGLRDCDLFFDLLTFTLCSGETSLRSAAAETLKGIARVKQLFPDAFSSLGVSNVSYGLPQPARPYLNSVFLHRAIGRGLDAAIIHAGKIKPLTLIPAEVMKLCDDLIFDRRDGVKTPLEKILEYFSRKSDQEPQTATDKKLTPEGRLRRQILDGDAAGLDGLIPVLLKKHGAARVIQGILLPGMDEVGRAFAKGQLQLPFVLRSAEVVKHALARLEPHLKKQKVKARGTLVLATVRGDIHDIGKNLVDMILSANGYRVVNLGIRQTAEDIMLAARKHKPDAIGLSGLLVESVKTMKEYLEIFAEAGLSTPVICGGAALSRQYLEKEMRPIYPAGVHYAKDAMDGLKILTAIVKMGNGKSKAKTPPLQRGAAVAAKAESENDPSAPLGVKKQKRRQPFDFISTSPRL
ncbi:MAG: homocysteine S-methyltransferase family protein, partial [Candidatus Edwardsbacteria bacterium]|nr:homocysteine S-methyltransferase family protein [Candidatus Edwardsbacteria bacterium]